MVKFMINIALVWLVCAIKLESCDLLMWNWAELLILLDDLLTLQALIDFDR